MFGVRPPGERRGAPASRSRARRPRASRRRRLQLSSSGALQSRRLRRRASNPPPALRARDVYERRVYRSRHHDENHDDGDEEQTRARAFGARGVSMHDVSQVELHATDARGGLAGRLGRLRDRRGGWAGSCEARVQRRGLGMKRGRGRAAEATRSGRGGVGRSVDAPVRPCRRRPLRRPRRPTRSGRVVARRNFCLRSAHPRFSLLSMLRRARASDDCRPPAGLHPEEKMLAGSDEPSHRPRANLRPRLPPRQLARAHAPPARIRRRTRVYARGRERGASHLPA